MDADLWPFHAFPWTPWILRRILWTGGNQTCALRLRTCAEYLLSPPLSPLSPPSAIIGIASCLPLPTYFAVPLHSLVPSYHISLLRYAYSLALSAGYPHVDPVFPS